MVDWVLEDWKGKDYYLEKLVLCEIDYIVSVFLFNSLFRIMDICGVILCMGNKVGMMVLVVVY